MRILVALDGSPSSIQTRDLVAGLQWPPGTVIRLVTAYEPPIDWTANLAAGMAWVGTAEDALRDELTTELRRLAEPFDGHEWAFDVRAVRGRAASAILAAAREFDADLIAVGSRGRGPLARMLLGSVSGEVVDQAPCSVLVARDDHVSRLLVASDGSDIADAIPHVLGEWGIFRGMASEALSVAPLPARTYGLLADVYAPDAYGPKDDRQALLDRHRGFAEDLARQLEQRQIPAASSVVAGDAADEIINTARRHGVDLIILGTRGLHGVERVILGSVARNVVVHAPSSVLVVRGRQAPPAADGRHDTPTTVTRPREPLQPTGARGASTLPNG